MWSKKKIFGAIAIFFTVKAILATIIIVFSGVDLNAPMVEPGTSRKLLQSVPGLQNISDIAFSTLCEVHGEPMTSLATGKVSCKCDAPYMNKAGVPCAYKGKSKLTAFLISFFVGSFGADWFYLASGDAGYIVAGVFKLLTFGCCGIWALVDWIRILANGFPDGAGEPLYGDM
jgi:TM2 domain-containing membrane protein YozV